MAPAAGTGGVGLGVAGRSVALGAVDVGGAVVGDAGAVVGVPLGAEVGDEGVGSPDVDDGVLSTGLVVVVGVVVGGSVVVLRRCTSVRGAQV